VLILAVGYLALVLAGNPHYVLTMTGRQRPVLVVNLVSALVLVAAGYVAGRFFGAAGLAAGSASSLLVQNGLLWWMARRELGLWTHVQFRPAVAQSLPGSQAPAPACRSVSPHIVSSPESLSSSSV
jgi:O-antigen/teichoic acid export membrane protein